MGGHHFTQQTPFYPTNTILPNKQPCHAASSMYDVMLRLVYAAAAN
jgi:hypothetical protein